jgi:hypothetical protein
VVENDGKICHCYEVATYIVTRGFPSFAHSETCAAMDNRTNVIVLHQLQLVLLATVGDDGRLQCLARKRLVGFPCSGFLRAGSLALVSLVLVDFVCAASFGAMPLRQNRLYWITLFHGNFRPGDGAMARFRFCS